MDTYNLIYRELIPDLHNQERWNVITLNTGGTQSTLQDIKLSEKSGGFCYANSSKPVTRNRFIYWRTTRDVLELSEISLDMNLYENNLRYKFTDSPVLSVTISEQESFVTLLVTTVCSLHRIHFPHPENLAARNDSIDTRSYSIFREATANSARDPSTFYVIGQNPSSNNPIPHVAASFLSPTGEEAYFALAYQSNLILYTMNCETGQTVSSQLKEQNIMPRLFSNIKGALIGKSNPSDNEHSSSLVFTNVNNETFLLALYRDDFAKLWSASSMTCVSSVSCLREGNENRIQGPQSNILKKINPTTFCAFLSQSNESSEFVRIRVKVDINSGYQLTREKLISGLHQSDLVDFEVSETKIWALWSNAEAEFNISNYSLTRDSGFNWVSAAMEPPPDRFSLSNVNDATLDPREAYCSYIFHPGKFDRFVISKALAMFRRNNVILDDEMTFRNLKERVCQAIEAEIQNEIKDYDITDDEYLEISARLWERFYTSCEQYHLKATTPVGLVILDCMDVVCVVKKTTFSLLRPCEILEHLILIGEDVDSDTIVNNYYSENTTGGEDLINLVGILALIEKWLPDEVKIEFDKKLHQLEMPAILISSLVDEITSTDKDREIFPRNFMMILNQKLQSITNLIVPMEALLNDLQIDKGDPESVQNYLELSKSSKLVFKIGNLFGSSLGISLLSETVRQMSLIRFTCCRNLMIFQKLLIDTFTLSLPPEVLETIRSQFMPDTGIYLQSYYTMVWIAETPINPNNAKPSPDQGMRRLNFLKATDIVLNLNISSAPQSVPLLRLFLETKALYTAIFLFTDTNHLDSTEWRHTLLPLANIVSQLIWPVSFNFIFGEWLFTTCHAVAIEDYVRLLNNWCEWNMRSRQFILAVSHLDCGESNKAYDFFIQSAQGVIKEKFLAEKILKTHFLEDISENQALSYYYLQVIEFFQHHKHLDRVISLAQLAIGLIEKDDPKLPMFQSIVFTSHLSLEHYEEAYHSFIYNAEFSRRKDGLRLLLLELFKKKRLDLIMQFPYEGLRDEFERIVETRARSLAIEGNIVYDFLYAYHAEKGNYRKASFAIYEQAMRCQLESDSVELMQKRYDSLLICLNCMPLIEERFRFITRPKITNDGMMEEDEDESEEDNKWDWEDHNNFNPDELSDENPFKEKITILTPEDIKKELLQTEALLLISKQRSEIGSYIHAGPQELAVLLCTCGLYTPAMKLATGCKIPLNTIFDSLTGACVRSGTEGPNEAWEWLQENDLADLPHKSSAAEMAWALLKKLVEENENGSFTTVRKVVVNKILGMCGVVPQWLINSYKADNSSELLRLFVHHGRLLEAAEYAKELVNAMLGCGSEYFDFKTPIAVSNPSLCLPIGPLSILLGNIEAEKDDLKYRKAQLDLEEVLAAYVETASRVSEDKIQLAHQRSKEMETMQH